MADRNAATKKSSKQSKRNEILLGIARDWAATGGNLVEGLAEIWPALGEDAGVKQALADLDNAKAALRTRVLEF